MNETLIDWMPGGRRKARRLQQGIKMIITFRRMIGSRTGSTTVMFAAFAAVITMGVMSLSKSASQHMMAAITKQAPLRY